MFPAWILLYSYCIIITGLGPPKVYRHSYKDPMQFSFEHQDEIEAQVSSILFGDTMVPNIE